VPILRLKTQQRIPQRSELHGHRLWTRIVLTFVITAAVSSDAVQITRLKYFQILPCVKYSRSHE